MRNNHVQLYRWGFFVGSHTCFVQLCLRGGEPSTTFLQFRLFDVCRLYRLQCPVRWPVVVER